jgi:hypothetical protein
VNAQQMIGALRSIARQIPPSSHRADLLFRFLADNVCLARLNSGARVLDQVDFAQWLRELADASFTGSGRPCPSGVGGRPIQGYFEIRDRTCPDCGHVHQDENECGQAMGGGRVCRCERKVLA